MKSAPPVFLLAAALSLAACTTTSNKRDLYSPPKAQGKWTQKNRGLTIAGRYDHRSRTEEYVVVKPGPRPMAPAAPAPVSSPAAPQFSAPAPTDQPPPLP